MTDTNDTIEVKDAKCPKCGAELDNGGWCTGVCERYDRYGYHMGSKRHVPSAIQTVEAAGMEVYPKGTLAQHQRLLLEIYGVVCKSDQDEEAVIESRWGEEVFRLLGGLTVDIKQINKGNAIPCPSCGSVDCIGYVHSGICNSVQLFDLTDWKARAEKAEAERDVLFKVLKECLDSCDDDNCDRFACHSRGGGK